MKAKPSAASWGFPIDPGYFSLRVSERSGEITFQYTLYDETGFRVSGLFFDVAPTTPLAALSVVLAQRPDLLDLEHVRALRDHLLAQPGALRAVS